MEEGITEIFGVKFSEVKQIPLSRIQGRHAKNPPRQMPEDEKEKAAAMGRKRVFENYIAEQGIENEIVVDADYYVLRGGRRYDGAVKAGLKSIPGRVALQKNIDERTLRKIIWKEDATREQRHDKEIRRFIEKEYGLPRIMQSQAGGAKDRGKSPGGLLSLEKQIEDDLGYPASTVRNWLRDIRQAQREKEYTSLTPLELTDGNLNAAKRAALTIENGLEGLERIDRNIAEGLATFYQLAPKVKGKALKIKEVIKLLLKSGKVSKGEIKRLRSKFRLE